MPHTTNHYPSFKRDQLEILSEWGTVRPVGLNVRIVTSNAYVPEVAMLYGEDRDDPRYLIYPKTKWRVVLVRVRESKWELPTLERALSRVVTLEPGSAAA